MKIAIYSRVSTDKQTTENQIQKLTDYADKRNLEVVSIIQDEGISGSKFDRVGLNQLVKMCKRKEVDSVLVWSLDRLGRSLKHLISLVDDFHSWGVDLIVYNQNIDTTTPSGRLMFQIIGAVAEFERELIRERVRLGLERARKEGKQLGRPTREVDSDKMLMLKNQGLSLRSIASQLNLSKSLVHKTIKNLAYKTA